MIKPGKTTPGVVGAINATTHSTGKNAMMNTSHTTTIGVADGTADWGTLSGNVRNLAGIRFLKSLTRMSQIEAEIDDINKNFGQQANTKPRSNDTTTTNVTAGGLVDGTLPENMTGASCLKWMQQMQTEIDGIKNGSQGGSNAGQRRLQANRDALVVRQFQVDVQPTQMAIAPAGGKNGHRRGQTASCSQSDIAARSQAITAACCGEAGEDCRGGLPQTCDADCANELVPFWQDCEVQLGAQGAVLEQAVELCRHRTPSLAEQLNVECTDGTPEADCVPRCAEEFHGYQLLLNIGGEDSKMSCELHHELYSWVGGAVRVPVFCSLL